MLTGRELRELTYEQRKEYFIGKTYRRFELDTIDIGVDSEQMDLVYVECLDGIAERDYDEDTFYVILRFPYQPYYGMYFPTCDKEYRYSIEFNYDGESNGSDERREHAKKLIKQAIGHARRIKRLNELEAENSFLRANKMTLPLPVTDAIVPHLLAE